MLRRAHCPKELAWCCSTASNNERRVSKAEKQGPSHRERLHGAEMEREAVARASPRHEFVLGVGKTLMSTPRSAQMRASRVATA